VNETTPAWAVNAATRQGLYRMFGRALLTPEEGVTETLSAAADYLEAQDLTRFAFYPHWLSFRSALADAPAVDELATTHVRLFASGVDGALCPPIESWYKTEARFGGTAELVAVLEADYRALGLAVVGTAEPPDHASTQLEAMSALCAREAEAWRSGRDPDAADALEGQDRFLRAHLATWFGDFAARVRSADPDGWYHAVTKAVDAFVIQEVDLVRAVRRQLGAA
jgi:TorA maturation chaperone TorD